MLTRWSVVLVLLVYTGLIHVEGVHIVTAPLLTYHSFQRNALLVLFTGTWWNFLDKAVRVLFPQGLESTIVLQSLSKPIVASLGLLQQETLLLWTRVKVELSESIKWWTVWKVFSLF